MLCVHFRPVVGGAERQAERLAHALLRRGCHVEVLTSWIDPDWPERESHEGLTIRRFPLTDLGRSLRWLPGRGLPNLLIERREVHRAIRRHLEEFDLLHMHIASPVAAFALEAAHALGKPVLCKVACGGTGFDFVKLRAASVFGERLQRRLVAGVDGWVAISREVRGDLRAAGVPDDRIVSIPNGIDAAAYPAPRPRPPARRFLCMGRHAKLDLATLLVAFDAIAAALPAVELRIAGVGDAALVQRQLERLPHARPRTAVVGVSPVEKEFAWADALVHPSLAEGIANTLLEAMCDGLPVIASDIPPNREVLDAGRGGLLVPLHDALALQEAMHLLAGQPLLAARRTEAARRRVEEHYAIDAIASRYLPVYDALLGALPKDA